VSQLQGKRILVIDDDPGLLHLAELVFSRQEALVYTAASGQEGLRQFYTHHPDLVILDLMMPEMDGWEVCRRIREISDVPVIMLTALGRDEHIIQGLEAGADDYLPKPFNNDILLARARAVLRRMAPPHPPARPVTYSDGHLTIDLNERRVLVREEPVKLSGTEYQLLTYFLQNSGRVLTFQQILKNVWGEEYQDHVEYVHAYVWHLRQKLEEDPRNPVYLLTEHGVGYHFEKHAP
jgi:two-component system KDP operon response regulator KdpE